MITLEQKNRGYNGEIIIGGVPLNEVNETNLMQRVVLVRHGFFRTGSSIIKPFQ